MNDDFAAIRPRDASAHDEAADRHMQAAVHWRDLGQARRAVLEVKYAMAERELAQLERDQANLENELPPSHSQPPTLQASIKGAVELVYADKRWHILVDGDPEANSSHEYRLTAIVVARETAHRMRRELVIRGRDGNPREHVSYGEDPPSERVIYRRPELRRA